MAAIAFDPLEYSRLLESAGVPRDQAEVHARVMTTAFLHNVDALVTRDYLDSRFNEFEARIEANFDNRFAGIDGRLDGMDARLDGMDARLDGMDARFDGMDARLDSMDARLDGIHTRLDGIDTRFASIDVCFARIDGQFGKVYVMQGIIMVAVAIPALQGLFG